MYKKISLATLSVIFCVTFMIKSPASAQQADEYRYVHPECNFSIAFPEAPAVQTIWADKPLVLPRIEFPKGNDYRGEIIKYQRGDFATNDIINVEAKCISLDKKIAQSLTQKGIMLILKDIVAQHRPQETRGTYSEDGGHMRWGTVKAYVTNEKKEVFFHTHHLLVGMDSMMIVSSWYTTGNPLFKMEYDNIQKSIILN